MGDAECRKGWMMERCRVPQRMDDGEMQSAAKDDGEMQRMGEGDLKLQPLRNV